MKNQINFRIWFKKIKHTVKSIGSDADRDWKIIISLFFLIFFATILFHINLFFSIQNGLDNSIVSTELKEQPLDSGFLAEMVSKYDSRADEYQKIENTELQLVDPS